MPQDPIIDDEYASDDDSDFAPGAAPAENGSESESESESERDEDKPIEAAPKRKRTETNDANADANADLENSGDEAIIHKGGKRQKKTKRTEADVEDEGGEGGLIKTRRQRAQEKAERKTQAITGPVTINVDEIWAQMNAAPLLPARNDTREDKENQHLKHGDTDMKPPAAEPNKKTSHDADSSNSIKIKRTYNFAGKVHTEEKLVPRDSAEAKLFLASQGPKSVEVEAEAEDDERPKRKPRRAFRSIFEPVVEGLGQRADLKLGMDVRLELREQQAKAKKLNVVEKSRMDWAGFVDKEGIKDELELAGKSKESYVSRQDFLHRVEANKDEEARRARIAGRG